MVKLPFKIRLPKFKIAPQGCLGVDIGTAFIKIVNLRKIGARTKLENYGETSALTLYKKPFRTFEKNTLLLSTSEIAKSLKAILAEAKIKEKAAVFSIPDFSSFFTSFELPPMTKEELPQAVQFAAPQHVPLPLSEVALDWQVVEGKTMNKKGTELRILLVAVPNEVIYQYQEIAKASSLELKGLEAEVFSLARAAVTKEDKKTIISIIDIGAQSTTCSIIDKGTLKLSHSFDIAGNELTQILAKSLNLDYQKAEELKRQYGLRFLKEVPEGETPSPLAEKNPKKIAQTLSPTIDSILVEVKRIFKNFYQNEKKEVQKVILAGGTALLPGAQEHFASTLAKETEIINPFADIFYPPVLEKTLREMGPGYAIATGAALRGLE
jgi:type IV pilus assembly protein PilM